MGKGAPLRAVPAPSLPSRQAGEGREGAVGTLRFAYLTTLPYDRNAL